MAEIKILTEKEHGSDDVRKVLGNYKYGETTDFGMMMGAATHYDMDDPGKLFSYYWIIPDGHGKPFNLRSYGVRPVVKYTDIKSEAKEISKTPYLVVEYGEYPQSVVSPEMSIELDKNYNYGSIVETGKVYTNDEHENHEIQKEFSPMTIKEYEYKGKKYVRVESKVTNVQFSNNEKCIKGRWYWVEVEPIRWKVVGNKNLAISEKVIIGGIQYNSKMIIDKDFSKTDLSKFLQNYFEKEIKPTYQPQVQKQGILTECEKTKQETAIKEKTNRKNPYKLDTKEVTEEDIIKGALESDLPVFLHGPSSEGKSARIKAIDPKCVTLYLSNSSPESLNGKSVYNSETGEMIDIKPSWLKKLEARCEEDPDNIHIVFFDELTNALPSIQGMAFNIILNKEVNGIWELPKNARIAAAGNEMNDSLSAYQLSEPLYNRFAHVYIKTTPEGWLKWASDNDIHPAIYSYIASTNGTTLRTEFTGETPNADPRKWEMASKMLYKTNNPEMLRCLLGEEVTKEFIRFCNQPVITVKDVLDKNYTEEELKLLTTDERYQIAYSLSQVKEENLDEVRRFMLKVGKEPTKLFDTIWVHNSPERLERLQEAILENEQATKSKNATKSIK